MKHTTCLLLLLCLFLQAGAQENNQQHIYIYGEINALVPVDTVEVIFWEHQLDKYSTIPAPQKYIIPTRWGNLFDGTIDHQVFSVTIPLHEMYGRIRLSNGADIYLDQFLVEAGDTIRFRINLERGYTVFGGPGSEKYRLQYDIMRAGEIKMLIDDPVFITGNKENFLDSKNKRELYLTAGGSESGKLLQFIEPQDQLEHLRNEFEKCFIDDPRWQILKYYQPSVPKEFMEIMKADLVGETLYTRLASFGRILRKEEKAPEFYYEKIQPVPIDEYSPSAITNSPSYQDYLLMRIVIESNLEKKSALSLIIEQFTGDVRDMIIGKFLVKYHRRISNLEEQISAAIVVVETPWVMNILNTLYATQLTGSEIKDFMFTDVQGKEVNMADLKGRVLLLDFWFTGCKACIHYYNGTLSKAEEHFIDNKEVLIVSISADKDKDLWLKSVRSGKYTSEEILNLNSRGFEHPFFQKYNIHSFPSQMIIDSKGKIALASNLPSDPKELINIIEKIINKK